MTFKCVKCQNTWAGMDDDWVYGKLKCPYCKETNGIRNVTGLTDLTDPIPDEEHDHSPGGEKL